MDQTLEDVSCFRCGDGSTPLFHRDPFAIVRCDHCGQVFVRPRLSEQAVRSLYEDRSYYEAPGGVYGNALATRIQRRWTTARLDLIERHLNGGGRSLLEIGCGYGLFLEHARARGFAVSGLEYSRAAAAEASRALGVEVRAGAIEHTQIDAGSADVVCFWDVIEHVRDPGSFLARVREIVRPGGLIALSCPDFSSWPAKVLRSRWWTLRPEQHLWHYTPQTLRMAFEDAGMPIIRMMRGVLSPPNITRPDGLVAIAQRPA